MSVRKDGSCKGCYWEDQCGDGDGCDEYTPLFENESEIENLIDENKIAYRKAFNDAFYDDRIGEYIF